MANWPRVPLGELIQQDRHYITTLEDRLYSRLSVKMYGRGVVLDTPSNGTLVKMERHQFARSSQIIVSEIWAKKGAIGIVPREGDGALVTSHFFLFDIVSNQLTPGWISWLLRGNYFESQLSGDARGTTSYASVRPAKFLQATIPLPPLPEQRRIVAQLDAAAAGIEAHGRIAGAIGAELDATLASIFRQITAGAPRSQMGDVAPLVRREVVIDSGTVYQEVGARAFGRGLFRKPDVTGSDLTWQKLFRIEEGDLVFSNIKAWEGAFAVAGPEHHGKVGSHRYLTCVPALERATSQFLWFYLQTPEGLEQIQAASPGSADRNRTLGTAALARIEIPLPSLEDQCWFDAIAERAGAARKRMKAAQMDLDALLPALLHRALGSVPEALLIEREIIAAE